MQAVGTLALGVVLGWAATGFGMRAARVAGALVAAGVAAAEAALVLGDWTGLAVAGAVSGALARLVVETILRRRSAMT